MFQVQSEQMQTACKALKYRQNINYLFRIAVENMDMVTL